MADQRVAFVVSSLLLGALIVLVINLRRPSLQSSRLGGWSAEVVRHHGVQQPEAARILSIQLANLQRQKPGASTASKALALRSSLGHVYRDSGNYREAIENYQVARDLAMELGQSEQIVVAQTSLGTAYRLAGKLREARQELEAANRRMDQKSQNAVSTQWSLANVCRDSGKIDEALLLYSAVQQQVQQRQEPVAGQAQEEQSQSGELLQHSAAGLLSDIGQAYQSRGQLEKALQYYKQALDGHADLAERGNKAKDVQGSVHDLELATIHNRLGSALHDQGNMVAAAEHYQHALRLQQKALRADHPRIAETLMNIARNQQDSGEGASTALSTIEWAERLLLGKEATPEFAGVLSMKADLLRENGRLEEAEHNAQKALEAQELTHGGDDVPDMAITLIGLGNIVHDRHEYREAVKHYMRALAINLKTVGTLHPETAATYNNLGNAYQDSGDLESAERYYNRCLEIQKQIFEDTNPDLAATYNNLATILLRQQKLQEAEKLMTKAVEVARKAGLPPSSPSRTVYEENLSEVREHLAKNSVGSSPLDTSATAVTTV